MRFIGSTSWLAATMILLLLASPATGQFSDNVLVQGSPYGALSAVEFDDSGRLHVARGYSILIIDPETLQSRCDNLVDIPQCLLNVHAPQFCSAVAFVDCFPGTSRGSGGGDRPAFFTIFENDFGLNGWIAT